MLFYPKCRAILSVVFDGFGAGDSKPMVFEVRPKSAKVCHNSYKEADTWDMEFDGKALPISPDMIRGAAVQLYIYATDGLEDGDPGQPTVVGLVDSATLSAGLDGVTIRLTGRDYTCLMLDKEWDPQRRVPTGKALNLVIQDLVDEAAQTAKTGRTLKVTFVGDTPPVVGGVQYKKTKKRGFVAQGVKNSWDVIYKLATHHGYIVFVQGFEVLLCQPKTLQDRARMASRFKVAYGRNLETLDVDRKLGKERVPQIVVRSYDPSRREAIEARFPAAKDKVTTGVGTDKNEVLAFNLSGVTDVATLKRAAENAYNTLARGESTIKFTTPALKDLENDFDLWTIRAGDAVMIAFDPYIADATLQNLPRDQRKDRLIAVGLSDRVAQLIADNYDKINYFRKPFYVRESTITFDEQSGISVSVEAVNFVAVTRDEAVA